MRHLYRLPRFLFLAVRVAFSWFNGASRTVVEWCEDCALYCRIRSEGHDREAARETVAAIRVARESIRLIIQLAVDPREAALDEDMAARLRFCDGGTKERAKA